MATSYFKDKKILITGITGFIGSHLAEKLRRQGAKIIGVSKRKKTSEIHQVNIVNFSKLNHIIRDEKIDILFHLAGESIVEKGQHDPYKTFKTNMHGTLNILETARKHKVDRVIIASSSHVYGNNKVPYLEEYAPKPSRPYETSKTCTDLIAQSYADTFGLPVLIPRFVNIYGPGDSNFTRIVPKTIRAILRGENIAMWDGKVIRDYLYVQDAVDAYLKLARIKLNKVGKNRIFNFGSGNPISVIQLIERIVFLSGRNNQVTKTTAKRIAEIKKQFVSFEKASTLLNWKPKTSLDVGLKRTLLWYRNLYKNL